MTGTAYPRSVRSRSMVAWRSEAEMREAVEQAKATLRLEGLEVTAEQEALALRQARGEITHEEYLRLVVELATRRTSKS